MTAIRTVFIECNARPEPKTNRYCVVCQKDIKPGRPARVAEWELDTFHAIHVDDLGRARAEIIRPMDTGLLGADCAKRLGLEYSRPEDQ